MVDDDFEVGVKFCRGAVTRRFVQNLQAIVQVKRQPSKVAAEILLSTTALDNCKPNVSNRLR